MPNPLSNLWATPLVLTFRVTVLIGWFQFLFLLSVQAEVLPLFAFFFFPDPWRNLVLIGLDTQGHAFYKAASIMGLLAACKIQPLENTFAAS